MKFNSKPIPEHKEVPLADGGRWENIIEQWTEAEAPHQELENTKGNSCYVLSVYSEADPIIAKARLEEILNLVQAQADIIVGKEVYYLAKPNSRTLLGKGKAREIAERARSCNANLLVIDAQLSPSQMRNLEDMTNMSISDREGIILNVFLRNAKTRRAKIQVEIAQLEYLRPRIRGIGMNMDQQAGGISGGRGAGETASELLARKIDGRLAEFKRKLKKMETDSKVQRKQRSSCKRIVLVGYTNAGKTSLMNALTSEKLSAKNMPFETLDTTTRSLSRHGGDVLLSDTVGFIRQLPHRLLASFESTLEEIHEASLLMIVIDVSDYEWKEHLKITEEMLEKLGAQQIPRFYLFNKLDRISSESGSINFKEHSKEFPFLALSSKDKPAVKTLKQELLNRVQSGQDTHKTVSVFAPYAATQVVSLIYSKCRVIKRQFVEGGLKLTIQGERNIIENIEKLSGVKPE
ncbi:MAG: GTPase HflX [Leptospirales bacterium]